MDITQIAVPIVSAALSIGAFSAFIAKYISKTVKYVSIAKDAMNLLDDCVEALKDGQATTDEVNKIIEDVKKLKTNF